LRITFLRGRAASAAKRTSSTFFTLLGVAALTVALVCTFASRPLFAQDVPPELTRPVNDFAGVMDESSRQDIDQVSRALQREQVLTDACRQGDVGSHCRTFLVVCPCRRLRVDHFDRASAISCASVMLGKITWLMIE
jgi:hypothetical protein